jgi:RNA polymerase sigma factor (sigma-70 family)
MEHVMTGDPHADMAHAVVEARMRAATDHRRSRERPPRDEVARMARAAANGDATAWDWLVRRFHTQLVRTARGLGLGQHDSEDAAQATWIRLTRHIGGLREPGSLPAWLVTTTRREAFRIRAKWQRELPTAEFPTDAAADNAHDPGVLAAMRSGALSQALSDLPERHRDLMLALAAEPPLSYAEISALLGVPIGSIGPIRGRCLERLRSLPALRELLELED